MVLLKTIARSTLASIIVTTTGICQELDSELLGYQERFQRQSHNAYELEWISALP